MNKRLIAVLCLMLMLVGCAAPAPSSSSEPSSQPEVQAPKEPRFTDSIKILAIGNSYTQNAITYLHPILTDLGVGEVVVANLFIGGCDLTAHFDNTKNDAALYDYYKTAADGTLMKETVKYSIKQGLEDEDWDIIVLNQASAKAGQDMTYTKLDDLIVYALNPDSLCMHRCPRSQASFPAVPPIRMPVRRPAMPFPIPICTTPTPTVAICWVLPGRRR